MDRKKVVIFEHVDESGIEILEASNLLETVYFDDNPIPEKVREKALEEASGIIIRIFDLNRKMIQRAKNLEIISKHGVGFDNIDVLLCQKG